jgi:drug/metabolite transporter (DMT)-like permease
LSRQDHQLQIKGYLYITAVAALWGILGPFSRLAFSEGLQPMAVAFRRAALTWGFSGIHAAATHALRLDLRDLPMVALFTVTGVTAFYGTYQMAIRAGGAARASVLLYTAPAWVAMLARLVFKEPITRPKIIALVLTLIGVRYLEVSRAATTATLKPVVAAVTAFFWGAKPSGSPLCGQRHDPGCGPADGAGQGCGLIIVR